MLKNVTRVLVLGIVLTLSACSGVSQEDYDALTDQVADLEIEVNTLEGEKAELQNELNGQMVGYVDQSVEAYGFTHGGYVGQVTIVVTDGVLDVEINEAFLPHTLAAVSLDDAEWDETNTLTIGTSSYALYIMYNDTLYKALETEAGLLVYSEADETGAVLTGRWDVKNLEMHIIRNDANMKAYYDALENGGFKLMTSFDDASPMAVTSGQFKDGNPDYWQAGGGRLGWQANIDALEAFLEEYGAAFDTLAFTQVDTTVDGVEDTYWQVADTVAGATNSDFPDYFQLAQAAFGQLVTEVQ
ncbi:hypothetical protein [Candidatus Xianfuyuplasma coldseepsis]|uniref:Uncharacterized protein n=1 Tax=Candidatus Xianfuyuplasma coldseepsis TaxID=2782163 RepID=A0A7L7KQX4_9MOLU|nr:hypothetical protein [Xianfuyuplasma coldseepsis]QMS85220.1 hypothetical protein G4Z02_05485 [Xianfuyuplasma coldseepsis]